MFRKQYWSLRCLFDEKIFLVTCWRQNICTCVGTFWSRLRNTLPPTVKTICKHIQINMSHGYAHALILCDLWFLISNTIKIYFLVYAVPNIKHFHLFFIIFLSFLYARFANLWSLSSLWEATQTHRHINISILRHTHWCISSGMHVYVYASCFTDINEYVYLYTFIQRFLCDVCVLQLHDCCESTSCTLNPA